MTQHLVHIVVGSVRLQRKGPHISEWVAELASSCPGIRTEVVDLADWPLPMNDESDIPAHGGYATALTRAWSQKISAGSGFIFVTPQYNWGYPAALKNALDHLFREWRNKPAMIISYGGHGGGKCAEQLSQVLRALKMRVVPTMPALVISEAVIRGGHLQAREEFSSAVTAVQSGIAELIDLLDTEVEPTTPRQLSA